MNSLGFLMREPRKPKRDFLRENKRQVKKIEEQFRELRTEDNHCLLRNQKYASVQPKVQTRNQQYAGARRSTSTIPPSESSHSLGRPVSAYTTTTCDESVQCGEDSILHSFRDLKSVATQTDEDGQEGVRVLLPSLCSWEQKTSLKLDLDEKVHIQLGANCINQATERTASSKSSTRPLTGWNKTKSSPGGDKETNQTCPTIPTADLTAKSSDPLSKENLPTTLSQLRATQDNLVCELNRLPVRSSTLRAQMRRKEIDSQLDKVEALIAAMTKPF